jgi:tetratricopeptide (TPR) repeat protein
MLEFDYNSAAMHNSRGLAYAEKKEYDKALEEYNQTLLIDPSFAAAYNNCGIIVYHDRKEYDKAIEDYNQALKLNPNYTVAYNNRGLVYADKKGI